jgi:ribosomal protein S12 methylthiotransferase
MYLQPAGVTPELLAVMAAHPNICPYLDIPLQHASERVLQAMNREGSGQSYLKLLRKIRAALPNVALRTTVIAGYPGETPAEHRQLASFLEQAEFDYVGVFAYSREDGTPAASQPRQVGERTRQKRAQELRDLADAIGFERASRYVGAEADVLVCGYEDAQPYGRIQQQAPEVDGLTLLNFGAPGQLLKAQIAESCCYDLIATT